MAVLENTLMGRTNAALAMILALNIGTIPVRAACSVAGVLDFLAVGAIP
jgi:hypothetical protein